jgi:Flp pilus assembly protein TadB
MRWFKVAAVAAGALVAFFVISALMGYIIWGAMAALVIAVVVLSVKARSANRVSREEPEREIREPAYSSQPRRQKMPNIDDELARLKREMGN